jgi:hypothetical protein
METKKVIYKSTDITFHSRDSEPTHNFKRAQDKAHKKGSGIVRVYGIPRLVLDEENRCIHFKLEFSPEITKKIQSGELVLESNMPHFVDKETQIKIVNKKKKKLKNSTRVWRKR